MGFGSWPAARAGAISRMMTAAAAAVRVVRRMRSSGRNWYTGGLISALTFRCRAFRSWRVFQAIRTRSAGVQVFVAPGVAASRKSRRPHVPDAEDRRHVGRHRARGVLTRYPRPLAASIRARVAQQAPQQAALRAGRPAPRHRHDHGHRRLRGGGGGEEGAGMAVAVPAAPEARPQAGTPRPGAVASARAGPRCRRAPRRCSGQARTDSGARRPSRNCRLGTTRWA